MDDPFVDRLKKIVEENLDDPDFGVEQLARKMNMSYSSFRRKVSSTRREPASQLIREIRLGKAFELLQQGELTIGEIAFRCGFSSPNYFATCFQEYFGYSPSELKGERGEKLAEAMKVKEEKIARRESLKVVLVRLVNRTEWIFIPTVFIILIAASVIFGLSRQNNGSNSIAVLLPKNLGQGPQLESFCGGLQDQLLKDLKSNTDLEIISRITTDFYRNSESAMPEMGKKLKADLIIESSISQEDGVIFMNINLFDAGNEQNLWSRKYIRRLSDPFNLQKELSKSIISGIKAALLPEAAQISEDLSMRDPDAVKLYKLGKYYSDIGNYDPDLALNNFRGAIQRDTLLAGAYLGLASVLGKLHDDADTRRDTLLGECLWAIQRAAGINRNLPGIHGQYGHYYLRAGDFYRSVEESTLELDLNPGCMEAMFILAEAWMSLGSWDKAFNALHQALEESRYEALPNYHNGYYQELKRDFKNAGRHYSLAVSRVPDYLPSVYGLVLTDLKSRGDPAATLKLLDSLAVLQRSTEIPTGLANLHAYINIISGRYEEAIRDLDSPGRIRPVFHPWYVRPASMLKAMAYGFLKESGREGELYDSTRIYLEGLQETCGANRDDPRVNAALGIVHAGLGSTGKALEFAEKTQKLLADRPDALRGPYALEDAAFVYTQTGRYDKAIEIIRQLLSSPGPLSPILLETDPRWASLREQPDYRKSHQN